MKNVCLPRGNYNTDEINSGSPQTNFLDFKAFWECLHTMVKLKLNGPTGRTLITWQYYYSHGYK